MRGGIIDGSGYVGEELLRLLKGAAGQGDQCLNIVLGVDERTGLQNTGFHPM